MPQRINVRSLAVIAALVTTGSAGAQSGGTISPSDIDSMSYTGPVWLWPGYPNVQVSDVTFRIDNSHWNYTSSAASPAAMLRLIGGGRLTVVINDSTFTSSVHGGILADGQVESTFGLAPDYLDLQLFRSSISTTSMNAGIDISGRSSSMVTLWDSSVSTAGANAIVLTPGADQLYLVGSTIVGDIEAGTGSDVVVLQGSGSYAGSFLNVENLIGRGDWTLTGNSTFSNSFVVQNGTLTLDASATITTAEFDVLQGATARIDGVVDPIGTPNSWLITGTLTGTGSVNHDLFVTYATGSTVRGAINPGNGIGTLDIDGDVRFNDGTKLIIDVDPAAGLTADRLDLTGDFLGTQYMTIEVEAARSGLTVNDYVAGNDYTVATAASIDHDAPTLVAGASMPALLDLAVANTPTVDGQIDLEFISLAPSVLGQKPQVSINPNATQLATAIGTTATTSPMQPLTNGMTVQTALQSLTNGQLSQFNDVHGEAYSSYLTVGLEQLDNFSMSVLDHAAARHPDLAVGITTAAGGNLGSVYAMAERLIDGAPAESSPSTDATSKIWIDTTHTRGSVDGQGGLGDFEYDLTGVLVGGDLVGDETTAFGLFGGYGHHGMDEHDTINQEISADSFHAGAYGRMELGGVALTGAIGYMYGNNDSWRENADAGGFTGGRATSSFDSQGFHVGVRAHTDIVADNGLVFRPSVNVLYSFIDQDGATERGGNDFNYTIGDTDADAFVTGVGLSVGKRFADSGATAMAFARYEYDWNADSDSRHDVVVTSPIFGSFDQVGQNRGEHRGVFGAGVDIPLSAAAHLGLAYAHSVHSNGWEHGLGARLSLTW